MSVNTNNPNNQPNTGTPQMQSTDNQANQGFGFANPQGQPNQGFVNGQQYNQANQGTNGQFDPNYQGGYVENPFRDFNSTTIFGTDQTVSTIIKETEEFIKAGQTNLKDRLTLIPIYKDETNTFGGILVALSVETQGRARTGVQVWLVEATRTEMDPAIYVGPNNQQVEVPVASTMALNARFLEVAQSKLKNNPRISNDYEIVGTQVIVREAKIEKFADFANNLEIAAQTIQNAILAKEPGANKFSLALVKKAQNWQMNIKTSRIDNLEATNGLPIRADLMIEMTGSERQRNQFGNNGQPVSQQIQMQQSDVLCRTAMYVDLTYAPLAQQQMQQFAYSQQQMRQSFYVPRLTISSLSTNKANSAVQFLLLGLANAFTVANNFGYGVVFKQAPYASNDKGAINLKDIGAVGYQIPLAQTEPGTAPVKGKLDVASDDNLLVSLLSQICSQPVVTLEIDQLAANSAQMEPFRLAAMNTPEGLAAKRMVMEAADLLTEGHFMNILRQRHAQATNGGQFDPSTFQLFRQTNDLNYIGTFEYQGQVRPLAEIDQLALLNLAGRDDPELVRQFLRTYTPIPGSDFVEQRLDERLKLVRNFIGNPKVKGYTVKLDVMPQFHEALVAAIAATQVQVNANAGSLNAQEYQTQTYSAFQNVMLNPAAQQQQMYQSQMNGFNGGGFVNFANQGAFGGGYWM